MSNFKKKAAVPQDVDVRSIRNSIVEMGGTLGNAQTIIISGSGGGGAVDSVNGYLGTVVLNKTDIGLGNVNNTSDLNKPIPSGTQVALNLKADTSTVNSQYTSLSGIVDTKASISYVDTQVSGVDAEMGVLSGTLQLAISDIEDFKPADTWYVDGVHGNDLNNTSYGSFNHPYKTISAALSGIGNLSLQKIFILGADNSAPSENLLITQEDLIIQGIGTTNSYAFTLNANLVISGATRLQLKDLRIHTQTSGIACIQEIGSSGINIFDNVSLTHTFSDQLGYQAIDGNNGGGANFQNCHMTEVNIEINPASNNNYNFVECFNKQIVTNSGNFVMYRDSRAAGPFIHNGGGLILVDIITIRTYDEQAGDSIISTADMADGVLSVANTGLVQSDGAIGRLNKTGDCPYALARVQRDPSQDILTGFRFYPEGSFDIATSYTPVNYTVADEFFPATLSGIDQALGSIHVDTPVDRVFHVAVSGSNTTGNGSHSNPFATVEYALSMVPDGLTVGTDYAISLGSGDHNTPTCKLKPFVSLIGKGHSCRLIVANDKVELETINSPYSVNSSNEIHSLQLAGSTGIEIDLTSYTDASHTLKIIDCLVKGTVNYTGRAFGEDYIKMYNTTLSDSFGINNAQGEAVVCTFLGLFNLGINAMTPRVNDMAFNVHGSRAMNRFTYSSDGSRTIGTKLTCNNLPNLSLYGSEIVALVDSASMPSIDDISVTGGAALNKTYNYPRLRGVPTGAGSTGVRGDYAVDEDYRYDCVGINTWVRIPVATW